MISKGPTIRNHGFTLAEVLVVMLITSIIVMSVHASFGQVHAIWSRAESPRPQYQATRLLFETLRHEFAGLYIPPAPEQEQLPPFQLELTTDNQQSLSFFSLTPSWQISPLISRPAKITYTFINDPDSHSGHLERREQTWAANAPISEEYSHILATGLVDCEFLVIDPNDSSDNKQGRRTFTARDKPPKAVRIRLTWPENKQKQAVLFETCLTIPCQGNVPQDDQQ